MLSRRDLLRVVSMRAAHWKIAEYDDPNSDVKAARLQPLPNTPKPQTTAV